MMHRDDIIFPWTTWVKNQILFFFLNYFQTLKSDVKDVIFQSRKKSTSPAFSSTYQNESKTIEFI